MKAIALLVPTNGICYTHSCVNAEKYGGSIQGGVPGLKTAAKFERTDSPYYRMFIRRDRKSQQRVNRRELSIRLVRVYTAEQRCNGGNE